MLKDRSDVNTFVKMDVQTSFTSLYPRYNRWHAIQALDKLEDFLILDTETTGLGKQAEMSEIAIVDYRSGQVLLNTLIQPINLEKYEVSKARELTGISTDMLLDSPMLIDIWDDILSLLQAKHVTSFNTDFDLKMIRNSARLAGIRSIPPLYATCLMKLCTAYCNYDYSMSLEEARVRFQPDTSTFESKAHRALFDTLLTREIIRKLKGDA